MDSDDFDPEAVDEEGEPVGSASRDRWAFSAAGRCCHCAWAQPQYPIAQWLGASIAFWDCLCHHSHSFLYLTAAANRTDTYFRHIWVDWQVPAPNWCWDNLGYWGL